MLTALLGPTNTGKTHRAVEQMLEHDTGMIGLPLRLLAREIYDRITPRVGERAVALVTGEEKRIPPHPRYWVCTVESMPVSLDVDFVAVDEIQLAAHAQRGHTFTQRLLRARGVKETMFLGAQTMAPIVESLIPTARILRHPRYSKLTHLGTLSLGALPQRTAVVAFSVADVYELAERIRQRHGGTAVVTGALSPRTRNAQVAMYQAGEVHYMVATDAIGMGLNLDVDRVVFASRTKFDGTEVRALDPAELAQIAGRAGRYTSDGGFATLRGVPELHPRVVQQIENHDFATIEQLVWRNDELDFTDVDALLASLRVRPRTPRLRVVEHADDHDALVQLARKPEVRARLRSPADVELLWEVCRVPDFRKLLLESHVELLAVLFDQLSGPSRRIDPEWLATRLHRLDSAEGDIDALTGRIASIRVWAYVTHHEAWVHDALRWQELARGIEDRCSDALHERLSERFVARAATSTGRMSSQRRAVRVPAREPAAEDPTHPFARLRGLAVPSAPGEPAESDDAIESMVDAGHDAFAIDESGRVIFDGGAIAVLVRGPDILHPEVKAIGLDDHGAGAVMRVTRRLRAWMRDAIADLTAPLRAIGPEGLPGSARGLLYQLERGLGTLDGLDAREQIEMLAREVVERLDGSGVLIGREAVHVPAMATAEHLRLRAALWVAFEVPEDRLVVPDGRAVSIAAPPEIDPSYLLHTGYIVRGPRAIRGDVLARLDLALVDAAADGDDVARTELGGRLGVRRRDLAAVLRALVE
jgi:ATP-dependent RNA helicase SUPV3L1/SUV3